MEEGLGCNCPEIAAIQIRCMRDKGKRNVKNILHRIEKVCKKGGLLKVFFAGDLLRILSVFDLYLLRSLDRSESA